jgi:hypothetical protein
MSAQALIRRDDAALKADFTETAVALKSTALEAAALIGKVNSAETQEAAVNAQRQIAELLGLAEKAREACKHPVLLFGRRIDETARAFCKELKEEQIRIAILVGNFQALEQARVRAAQQAENDRLLALEREKAKELQKAETHEQFDAIAEKFNNRAAAEAPAEPIAPVRATGQRVREEWNVTVTDIWLLARAHPTCVKIEPMIGEIKTLLNAGIKVSGVKAEKEIRAGVVAGRRMSAIEV